MAKNNILTIIFILFQSIKYMILLHNVF